MKIFLSYPSEVRSEAEEIFFALEGAGYTVFFDRTDLDPAKDYHLAIQEHIQSSDLFIFLLTPGALRDGRYTVTELEVAKDTWRRPQSRVLTVELDFHDLARIQGLEGNHVELLEAAGIDTVVALARQRADDLIQTMQAENVARQLGHQVPDVKRVAEWIDHARQLPPKFMNQVDKYLTATTILNPKGNIGAEVLLEVRKIKPPPEPGKVYSKRRRLRILGIGALIGIILSVIVINWLNVLNELGAVLLIFVMSMGISILLVRFSYTMITWWRKRREKVKV